MRPIPARRRLWYSGLVPLMRGVAHAHSSYSFDGRLSLAELAKFFRSQGVDFVLLSEHVETLTPDSLQEFISQCERHSDDSILLIPGVEIDGLNALFYGIPSSPAAWDDWEDLSSRLIAAGALTAVSHPCRIRKPISPLIRRHAEPLGPPEPEEDLETRLLRLLQHADGEN